MWQTIQNWTRIVRTDPQGYNHIVGRKIYILPTRYGLLFGVLLILLLVGSINYANNPAFLLTFLLTGLFLQTIFHTWRNLLGLEIRWLEARPVFAQQEASFSFLIQSQGQRNHPAVQLAFTGCQPSVADIDKKKC